ncbi:SDR family NAD(P)-dependent oxidoreductase [Sandaracinomonas limnophila]|uniref:SDR family NAD(P)-dependent oxidoreductase n=1 Tax=Sandaracinomonas limnophila TaxID=1862386 RepID=A0A437PW34_9BACT|nr:SDR family NAD(P)-dependent oxidoreductase [Sandaracinomonas limnophila]RVU26471.1 SDR family NAD(P)-dependent oxidoreductase [Sandaracinomonas limnophila]
MNKIACVTGASSGIGRATALALASVGYSLILCGRRMERLEELQLEITTPSVCLQFDVKNQPTVQDAFDSLTEEWKSIDVLINNAGNAHGLEPIDQGEIDDWDEMIDVNVKGLLYVSKAVIPGMKARNKGHVVNLSSIAGKMTYANGAVYCASKAAVEALSNGMRLDLNPYNIKVSNIAPGAVNTEFSLVRFKGDQERADSVYKGFEPLYAENVADAIKYVVTAPVNVHISDLTILAGAQAAATVIHKG